MKRLLPIALIALVLLGVAQSVALAASTPPTVLSYQGRLANSTGDLLGSSSGTTYYFKFSVWDNPSVGSGNRVWPVSAPTSVSATVRQGVFTVNIGDTANGYPDTLSLDFTNYSALYLQVEVSSDNSTFETLSPRQQITAAAYAQVAGAVVGTTTQSAIGTTTPRGSSQLTLAATTSAATPLSIVGAASQSAKLLQILDNSYGHLFSISSSGSVFASSSLAVGGSVQLASLANCTLKTDADGNVTCGSDLGGVGQEVNWTWFNGSGVRPGTTTNQVLIGAVSTTTLAKLQVVGGASIDNASTTALSANTLAAGQTGTTTIAANGALFAPSLTVGSLTGLLKATGGTVSAASAGSDYVAPATTVSAGSGLSGGGDLSTNRTLSLNLSNSNLWTALQQFYGGASSTIFSAHQAYFGSTATSSFSSNGTLTLAGLASSGLGVNSSGAVYAAATTTAGTGLTYSAGAFNVNTTQNIAKLSNLTTNGFVKTSGGDGTLSIDTNTYLTSNQTITLSGDVTGSGATSITTTLNTSLARTWTGLQTFAAGASSTAFSANTLAAGQTATTTIGANGALYTPAATIGTLSGLLYGNSGVVAAASVSLPLSFSAGTLSINQANASTDGYLSSTYWSVFNNKISSTSLSAGSGISYNSSTGVITNTIGYPFPSNATTTLLSFGGGASTTNLSANTFAVGGIATTSVDVNGNLSVGGTLGGAGLSSSCNGSTQKLLWASGTFSCGTDLNTGGGGGGSDINWTYFNGSGIFVSTTTNQVVIGGSATTSLAKLEVYGGAYIDNASTTNFSANTLAVGKTGTTTVGTSGALYTPSLTVGSLTGLLKASSGVVSAAVADTDYATPASVQLFKDWQVVGNYLSPTTTLGIIVNASSTIGNGNQNGGLTIYGGATTTGNLAASGALSVGGAFSGAGLSAACNNSADKLLWANGTFSCGTDLSGGNFGQAWEISGGYLAPTSTITTLFNNGFVSSASSTLAGNLVIATSSANALPSLIINQTSSGDSSLRFGLGSTRSYAVGIDNSDSDALVISTAASGAAALGTSNLFWMSTAGAVNIAGNITTAAGAAGGLQFGGGAAGIAGSAYGFLVADSNGVFRLGDGGGGGNPRLILGSAASSGLSLLANGAGLDFRLGDNSGYASTTAANFNGVSTIASFFRYASTTNLTNSGSLWLTALSSSGLGVDSAGKIYAAATTTAGTGLTYSAGAFNVNTTQNIAKLSNLTTNGFVKTSGGDGTLSVDTNTYLTSADLFGKSWEITGNYLSPTTTLGIIVNASSTIGNGTQAGGLTIYGGATTTGNQAVTGSLSANSASFSNALPVSSGGTGANTLNDLIELGTHTTGNYVASVANSGGLTVSGSGSETASVSIGLNLANANAWTALQQFSRATSTMFSVTGTSYFGSTATTTIDAAGNVAVAGNFTGAGLSTCNGSADKLVWNGGQFACATDAGSGGGTTEINWTWFNGSGVRVATSSQQVLIGGTATTTNLAKLEVQGGAFFDSATSTNLNVSSTATFSGNTGFGSSTPSARVSIGGGNLVLGASGNPTVATTISTGSKSYQSAVSGKYLYVAEHGDGLRIKDISNPKNPTTVGNVAVTGNALAVVVAGKYAYVGSSAAVAVVDVSNPAAPVVVGTYSPVDYVYSLAVSGKYLYVTDYNNTALKILDISDPTAPRLAGSYTNGATAPIGVYVSGKYAYVADQGVLGFNIIDISNPAVPALVGTYATSSAPQSIYVSGKYAYVADTSLGFYIINIANPASPSFAGIYHPTAVDVYSGVQVAGDYAYVGDHGGNLLVLNVNNPARPVLVGAVAAGAVNGVTVSGKYAYVAGDISGTAVVDINGADLATARIGALESNLANISDDLAVGNNITAGGGLNVGVSGIFSRGTIAAYVASSTQTNPVVASFMGGNVGIGTSSPYAKLSVTGQVVANYFTATSSAASTLPYASSTAITVSGTGFFGTASTTALRVSGTQTFENLASAGLAVNASGQVYAAATTTFSGGLSYSNGAASLNLANANIWTALQQFQAGASTTLASVYDTLYVGRTATSTFSSTIANLATGGAFQIAGSDVLTGNTLGSGVTASSLTSVGTLSSLTVSGQTSLANASTTNFSANTLAVGGTGTTTISSTGALSTPSLTIATLSGLLKATAGAVSAASAGTDYYAPGSTDIAIADGGTNTSSQSTNGVNYFNGTSITSNSALLAFDGSKFGVGSSTPWAMLSVNPTAALGAAPAFAIGSSTATLFVVDNAGRVGIGTSTPFAKFAVTNTVAAAQQVVAYDSTAYTQLRVDSTGDVLQVTSGGDYYLSNDNFWVCTGGSITTNGCPSGAPTGAGNLVVENKLGVGTSTMSAKLVVETQDGTTDFVQVASSTAQNIFRINANGRVGIGTSTPFARLAVGAGGAIVTTENALTDGATVAIDWLLGNQQRVTLGGNRSVTFSNYTDGQILRLVVCQDGTGSRTVTWPAVVLWQDGTAPTLTTTANKCDLLTFVATQATSTMKVFGAAALNF